MMISYSVQIIIHLWALYYLTSSSYAQEYQPSYTVVAPKIVRPNSDFLVAVSLYNIPDEGGMCIFLQLINFSCD